MLLGFSQAWWSRMTMVNDTISYLDMGDYFFKGEWSTALNATWGPLHAGLLGFTLAIFKPSTYWEYPVVHLVLFGIFLFAFWCFDFFLRQMILLRIQLMSNVELHVPNWIWMTIGYTLFLWASLELIRVSETNPDMLVAAFFYLASGCLVRIRRGNAGWATYSGLGLALGLGYLTKAVMFPVSLLCLGTAGLMCFGSRRGTLGVLGSSLLFVAVSAPLILALSVKLGKPTFGEAGMLAVLQDIDHLSPYWQGDGGQHGHPLHPPREIFDRPATFEFASPVGGSYPFWYDPSYWVEGTKPRYQLGEMAKNLVANLIRPPAWKAWAFGLNGAIIAVLFVSFYVSGRGRLIFKDVGAFWFLLLPSLAALTMYGTLHVELRYIGGFVVVAILCLFFSIHMRSTPETRSLFSAVALLLLLMFMSPIGPDPVPKHISSLLALAKPLNAEPNPNEEVVTGLQAIGLRPGDSIASLEESNCAARLEKLENLCVGPSFWARLGGFRIVAEVFYFPDLVETTQANDFWNADPGQQEKVMRALASTGARAVVSRREPRGPDAASWRKVRDTDYYMHWLGSSVSPSATKTQVSHADAANGYEAIDHFAPDPR
jgi:hypothetical protein